MFKVVWYIVFKFAKIEFTFIILLMLYLYYCQYNIYRISLMVCDGIYDFNLSCMFSIPKPWWGNRNHSTIISNTCVRSGEDDLERLIFLKTCKNLKGLTRFSQFFLLVLPLKMQALNVRIIEEAVHNVHMLN